jgi:hypothetical protein
MVVFPVCAHLRERKDNNEPRGLKRFILAAAAWIKKHTHG